MYSAFLRHPRDDAPSLRVAHLQGNSGTHRYFRTLGPEMQLRFVELAHPESMPVAFLHGNPHLDNYAKSERGAAMVDFDRARFGPYGYDIVRFLVSLALRRAEPDHRLAHPVVIESFRRGYVYGVHGLPTTEMDALAHKRPKKWQRSTRKYLRASRKWGERIRRYKIDVRGERLHTLLTGYLQSRDELDVLETHRVELAAEVPGSMGKVHTLVLLTPLDGDGDQRLIDMKETYVEPDDRWFFNPFPHQGLRMVRAGEVHAPDWEVRPGWTSHDGFDYWCRQICPGQVKLGRVIDRVEQVDVAFSVASQLGRAHRVSMLGADESTHLEHFRVAFGRWVEIALQLKREVELGHALYRQAAAKLLASMSRTG